MAKTLIWVMALLTTQATAFSDVVKLKGGGKLDGIVLRDGPKQVVMLYESGVFRVDLSMVEGIDKTQTATKPAPTDSLSKTEILPTWMAVLKSFAPESWAEDLRQIPATVIDDGILKNVPYKSQRSGQYEFNVYGDPDAPAGFELGVYGYRIHDDDTKRACVSAIAKLLKDTELAQALRSLSLAGESKVIRGTTVEITPATAKDAYGGW